MKIWKFEEVGGQEFEVSEGYPVMFPFTDVAPLEDYPLGQQTFVPTEGKWVFIGDLALKDEFDNLRARYEGLENDLAQANQELSENQAKLAIAGSASSKAMLATINLERKVKPLLDGLTTTTTTKAATTTTSTTVEPTTTTSTTVENGTLPFTTTTTLKGDE
ncbi:hypothetical protein [Enterococcus phage TJE4]|jgi:hypothetical protein|uniref:Uncharacterized protein n=1 Tax=Enterococcus phage 9183 TaxID=2763102 RepID=A0A7L7SMK9_9CAUD|nr:hypothetical protein KNV65_gp083 [Enterococcus phage 9183]QOC57576.1 hypothetical protein phi9183_ORF083 [Enterococcus phage 9183]UVD42809.1 hypothetical protein [Enterococcus phage TJE4]DAM31077.1 MAG TPA: Tropomyosin alpha-1 chain-parallel coiled coil, CONTRACTILE PROTEIN.8A [Caudoviricetes sp.]